ncbi:MAG: ATP synthase F1 subunit epsilon [Pelagibacteraceae bacterium]|jgi:F-type H+-transporting ATPase subunit epsilon|nr:ATP synthase F1 subunit epsilon [Pelagibacteraceae bacterium]
MSEKFNFEIISPDQALLNKEVKQVSIPAYEGAMTILKDHISLITFLRPGFIEVEEENKIEKFYVEEGTVEFYDNKLLILSSSAVKLESLAKEAISKMIKDSQSRLQSSEIQDKDRYILSHKLEALEQIN